MEHKGYEITVSDDGLFTCPDTESKSETYKGICAAIDKHIASESKATRTNVFIFKFRDDVVIRGVTGEIDTSRGTTYIWITTADKKRRKESAWDVYLDTPENNAALDKITHINKRIDELAGERDSIKESMTLFMPEADNA